MNFDDLIKKDSIYLDGKELNDDGMKVLVRVLRESEVLEVLLLCSNHLTLADGNLADALTHNHTLRVLNLYNNKIGVEGARRLAAALKENDALQQLHLGWNHIGDKGAQALADSFSVNQSLSQIWLNSNRIGDKGAYKLASALARNHVPKRLALEDNRISSDVKKTIISISDFATQRDREMRIKEKQIARRERTIERKEKELASKDEEIASLKEALERQLAERSRKIEGNGIASVDTPELVSEKTQHAKKRRRRAPLHDRDKNFGGNFAEIAMEKEKLL